MYTNEQLIEFCQEAVRIPSYSGQEKGVAEFMKRKMEEYGFDEVIIDKYGSVLGTINGKRPGKTILMDGHIDTVDVIDAPQWKHDPFGGEIVDGRIYGRGTSDMKGSDCAMITAAARYAEQTGKDFAGKICVSCTVHEECFEGVSSREITRLAKPDFVIIGEATTTTVKRGQRGRAGGSRQRGRQRRQDRGGQHPEQPGRRGGRPQREPFQPGGEAGYGCEQPEQVKEKEHGTVRDH